MENQFLYLFQLLGFHGIGAVLLSDALFIFGGVAVLGCMFRNCLATISLSVCSEKCVLRIALWISA
jgi:hypothetical protein